MAAALKVSVRYLQEVFQEAGKTPSGYIWECRLENAKGELANPFLQSLSIYEIAVRNGFSDLGHFGRRFRAAYGVSPREFRSVRSSSTILAKN